MFPDLSREEDAKTLRMYPMGSLRSLNLDRIRGIIEEGADTPQDDVTMQNRLVQSIDQVAAYDPEMRNDVRIGNNLLEYSMMQCTSAPVLRKLLQLWPIRDDLAVEMSKSRAPSDALRQVLVEFQRGDIPADPLPAMPTRGGSTLATTVSATPMGKCAWIGCTSPTVRDARFLKQCSRCKQVKYCSKECQKSAWIIHRYVCVSHEVPRHRVPAFTVETLQRTVDLAQAGDVVVIPAGTYGSSNGNSASTISMSNPIFILGDGMDKVTINADLKYTDRAKNQGKVVIANLTVGGIVQVKDTACDITLLSVGVKCPHGSPSDAVAFNNCQGKVLLDCCEIYGGSNGLCISQTPRVHIKETDVELAQSRGIFADNSFVIENSAVYNCGEYGITCRSGWEERGQNEIQPGP